MTRSIPICPSSRAAVNEFVTSILEDRTPFPSDIDAAYWTGVGLLAHESAMEGGTVKSLPKYEEL